MDIKHEIIMNSWRPTVALVFEITHAITRIHTHTHTLVQNCINHLTADKIDYFNLMLSISQSDVKLEYLMEVNTSECVSNRCHTKSALHKRTDRRIRVEKGV